MTLDRLQATGHLDLDHLVSTSLECLKGGLVKTFGLQQGRAIELSEIGQVNRLLGVQSQCKVPVSSFAV